METIDSSHMRNINSNILLKMIWQQKEISRADLSRLTGMSRSTVSAIVADLMDKRLVSERGIGHSNGGRRPVMLSLNADSYSLLGIDVGVQHIGFVHSNLRAEIISTKSRNCMVQKQPLEAIAIILEGISSFKEKAAESGQPLLGIGIGVPCPVHPSEQSSPMHGGMMPAWAGYNLREIIQQSHDLPLFFENDANLGALAELWWGKEENRKKNMAFVKLCRRVGAGLIIDGKIHRGSRGLTGEIGHVILNVNQGKGEIANGPVGTIQRWIDAMLDKEPSAEEFFDEGAFYLGIGLTNLLALLDLDAVVFGGSVLPGERLIPKLSEVIKEHSLYGREVELSWSHQGEYQIALGAVTLVLEKLLDDVSLVPEPARDTKSPHKLGLWMDALSPAN